MIMVDGVDDILHPMVLKWRAMMDDGAEIDGITIGGQGVGRVVAVETVRGEALGEVGSVRAVVAGARICG